MLADQTQAMRTEPLVNCLLGQERLDLKEMAAAGQWRGWVGQWRLAQLGAAGGLAGWCERQRAA